MEILAIIVLVLIGVKMTINWFDGQDEPAGLFVGAVGALCTIALCIVVLV